MLFSFNRVVNGLEACLYEYLNISPEKCKFYSVISKSLKVRFVYIHGLYGAGIIVTYAL